MATHGAIPVVVGESKTNDEQAFTGLKIADHKALIFTVVAIAAVYLLYRYGAFDASCPVE